MKKTFETLQGIALGLTTFFIAVFLLAALAAQADIDTVKSKINTAVIEGAIQYPGAWHTADARGLDTFTDCVVLQAAMLYRGSLREDLFSARTYGMPDPHVHPCDTLAGVFLGVPTVDVAYLGDYSRYWWGPATLAKAVLGLTDISVADYSRVAFFLSVTAFCTLIAAFLFAYGRAAFGFAPFFFTLGAGFGTFTFWQSISHAPEFVTALYLLALYAGTGALEKSPRLRAAACSLLGAACVYLDTFDAAIGMAAIVLGCVTLADCMRRDRDARATAVAILQNFACMAAGIVGAVALRLAGHALTSNAGFWETVSQWLHVMVYRMGGGEKMAGSGKLTDCCGLLESGPGLLFLLGGKNSDAFYGILSSTAEHVFRTGGYVAWLGAVLLALWLRRRNALPACVLPGFMLAALPGPAWYLLFRQHTLEHPWMTGRLLSLFCGLGFSLLLVTLMAVWRGVQRNSK